MDKNMQIIKTKNNFFSKLLYKIKKFFKKSQFKNSNTQKDNGEKIKESKDEWINNIKISDSFNNLLKLKEGIENGEISIADISDNVAEKLVELYEQQNI